MSFYGSVYYQLIDTFYKIIVKNSGDKNYTFIEADFNTSGTPEENIVESPAIGRKGIFSLDSGNYWINFSKVDSVDEAAPYKIWHNSPHDDPTTMQRVSSWDIINEEFTSVRDERTGVETGLYLKSDTEKTNNLLENDKWKDYFVQLTENDFLRLYESNYDEAGHIIPDETRAKTYRLPNPKMNDKVNVVIDYIGEPNEKNNKIPLKWNNSPEDGITLTQCVEQTWDDVNLLEQYTGEWNKIADSYNSFKPTVASVIGDMDNLYSSSVNKKTYKDNKDQNFVSILGDLPTMWKALNENKEVETSFSEAIVKLKSDLELQEDNFTTFKGLTEEDILNIQGTIARDYNRGYIYPEINNLYNLIASEGQRLDAADLTITNNFNSFVNSQNEKNRVLDEKDNSLQSQLDEFYNAQTEKNNSLDGEIDALIEKDTKLDEIDAGLRKDLNTFQTNQNIKNEALDTKDQELQGALSTLQGTVVSNNENVNKRIDGVQNLINGPDSNTIYNRLSSLESYDQTNTSNITAINNNITTINSNITTITDTIGNSSDTNKNTVYSAINKNTETFKEYATSKHVAETYQTKIDAFTKDQADELYLVEADVADLRSSVSNISNQIGNINLEEGQSIATTLQQILIEIEGIKEEINKLKPTEEPTPEEEV